MMKKTTIRVNYEWYLDSLGFTSHGFKMHGNLKYFYYDVVKKGKTTRFEVNSLKKLAKMSFEKRYEYLDDPIHVEINGKKRAYTYIDETNAPMIYKVVEGSLKTEIAVYLGILELEE